MRRALPPLLWLLALLLLFFMDPSKESGSLCLFRLAGFQRCPGCGIGHAIHYALHMDLAHSFQAHVLGIPATAALLHQLVKTMLLPFKKFSTHDPATMDDAFARP